ncbi:hypothetical protein, partial [Nocardia cyriacigeorgica]|uniref:hypothetical protein n=1 Tax=Nocardia cyriacigeorgica TaxID=135487 RepID=UPI0014876142
YMADVISALVIAAGVAAAFFGALRLLDRNTVHPVGSVPVGDILRRCEQELLDSSMWPINWPHDAPADGEMSVPAARQAMRTHLTCDLYSCARKRIAYRALADAGVLIPDSRGERFIR